MIDVLYMAFRDAYALNETPLRLLHYTTFRMFLAFVTAFALTFLISPRVIATRALKLFTELNADSKYPEVRHASLSIGVASVPPHIDIVYRQLYKQADLTGMSKRYGIV